MVTQLLILFLMISCSNLPLPKATRSSFKVGSSQKTKAVKSTATHISLEQKIKVAISRLQKTAHGPYLAFHQKMFESDLERCDESTTPDDCRSFIMSSVLKQIESLDHDYLFTRVIDQAEPFPIQVNWIEFDPNMIKSALVVNHEITKFFQESLCFWPITSLKTKEFKNSNNGELKDFISTGSAWVQIINTHYLQIGMKAWSFCGGAHGNASEANLLFDAKTGKNLKFNPKDLNVDILETLSMDFKEISKAYECDITEWDQSEWDLEFMGTYFHLSPSIDFPVSDSHCYEKLTKKIAIGEMSKYFNSQSPSLRLLNVMFPKK